MVTVKLTCGGWDTGKGGMTGLAGNGGAIIDMDTGVPDDTGGGTMGGMGGGAGGSEPGIGGGIMPGIGGGIDIEGIIMGGGAIMPIGIIGGIMPEILYIATTRLCSQQCLIPLYI